MRTVYECNGSLSLDKKYLEGLADGKGEVTRYEPTLSADLMDELIDLDKNTFNESHYQELLEDGKTWEANAYWEQHHKCIPTPKYGFNW